MWLSCGEQVLVEFWLNQNTYNGGQGDLLAQAQVSLVWKRRKEKGIDEGSRLGQSYCTVGHVHSVQHTVEPRLTDTPQQ